MQKLKTMYSLVLAAAVALAGFGGGFTASAAPLSQTVAPVLTTYEVTIQNLTSGQPFSPPVAVTHSADVAVFHVGDDASDALAAIAQAGNPAPMVELFTGAEGVTDVVNVGRPLTPSGAVATVGGAPVTDSATFTITAAPGDFLSLATMLICTNDGFTGLDSAVLPAVGEEAVFELNGFDAGREENTELSADLVDPCTGIGPVALDGDPNGNEDVAVATDPIGIIAAHPGISGTGDLSADEHSWTEPVAQVTIVAVDSVVPTATYEVTLSNLTAGQPFSPPVAVTHAADVSVFQPGDLASDELAAIAQAGNPAPMVELFTGAEGVTDVVNVGRPLTPAGTTVEVEENVFTDSATFTIEAAPGDFLSLATMLICTNDGFTGLNAAVLPEDGSSVFVLRSYDAGREENTELSADLVDPCSGLGPIALDADPDGNEDVAVATDPATAIVRHPNIAGVGDLTAAEHGWEEPVATVLITRLDDAMMEEEMMDTGLVTIESANSFDETVAMLESALEEQGLLIANVIDHQANAAEVGLELPPTTLILTGNPNLGTPLMQASRSIAIDLPQKFLVWEDEEGAVFITYNDPSYLAQRHGITGQDELLEQISTALGNFAEGASAAMMEEAMAEEEAMAGDVVEVTLSGFAFNPAEFTVDAGTTVVWINGENVIHTVTAADESFDSGDLNNGDEFTVTFDQPGVFVVYCQYHGTADGEGMVATVTVQ